jgi:hypothetical protein
VLARDGHTVAFLSDEVIVLLFLLVFSVAAFQCTPSDVLLETLAVQQLFFPILWVVFNNYNAVTDRATLQIQELAALTGINNADIAKNRTKTNTGGAAPVTGKRSIYFCAFG